MRPSIATAAACKANFSSVRGNLARSARGVRIGGQGRQAARDGPVGQRHVGGGGMLFAGGIVGAGAAGAGWVLSASVSPSRLLTARRTSLSTTRHCIRSLISSQKCSSKATSDLLKLMTAPRGRDRRAPWRARWPPGTAARRTLGDGQAPADVTATTVRTRLSDSVRLVTLSSSSLLFGTIISWLAMVLCRPCCGHQSARPCRACRRSPRDRPRGSAVRPAGSVR